MAEDARLRDAVECGIDLDRRKACASKGVDTECLNTGFVQATVTTGGVTDFVKKVCSKAGSPAS